MVNNPALNTGNAQQGASPLAAIDLGSCGALVLEGRESKDFLQRISTNNVASARTGSAVQTVLTTEKGRVVDVVTAVIRDASILLLTSEGSASVVKEWLERYIIMEDIAVRDETSAHAAAVIVGTAEALQGAEAWSADAPLQRISGFTYIDRPAMLLLGSSRDELQAFLQDRQIALMDHDAVLDDRIAHGIPVLGAEITEKTNPLEAGLRSLVDFRKGCYIGQEVIARLSTYDKVQRVLCRVRLSAVPEGENGGELVGENAVHGYITTIGRSADGAGTVPALAVVRTASAAEGAQYALAGTPITATIEHVFS